MESTFSFRPLPAPSRRISCEKKSRNQFLTLIVISSIVSIDFRWIVELISSLICHLSVGKKSLRLEHQIRCDNNYSRLKSRKMSFTFPSHTQGAPDSRVFGVLLSPFYFLHQNHSKKQKADLQFGEKRLEFGLVSQMVQPLKLQSHLNPHQVI